MDCICRKCDLAAQWTPTGRDGYVLRPPTLLAAHCPDLAAKLREKGSLTGPEAECDHLNRAAAAAFEAWHRRTRL